MKLTHHNYCLSHLPVSMLGQSLTNKLDAMHVHFGSHANQVPRDLVTFTHAHLRQVLVHETIDGMHQIALLKKLVEKNKHQNRNLATQELQMSNDKIYLSIVIYNTLPNLKIIIFFIYCTGVGVSLYVIL